MSMAGLMPSALAVRQTVWRVQPSACASWSVVRYWSMPESVTGDASVASFSQNL